MLKKKISPTNIIFEIFPNGIRRINGKKFAVSTGISISPPPKLQVQGQFAYPPLVLGTSRVWFPKYVLRKGGGASKLPTEAAFLIPLRCYTPTSLMVPRHTVGLSTVHVPCDTERSTRPTRMRSLPLLGKYQRCEQAK